MKKGRLFTALILSLGLSLFGEDLLSEEGLALRAEIGPGLIAAHRFLPLGARIRVVNRENSRSAELTIESSLEEAANRLLVLSSDAADRIGMGESAWVKMEVLDLGLQERAGPEFMLIPAGPRPPATGAVSPDFTGRNLPPGAFPENPGGAIRAAGGPARVIPGIPAGGSASPLRAGQYLVQAGAFQSRFGADRALARVKAAGYTGTLEQSGGYYRVLIPAITASRISELASRLGREGIKEIWLRPN